MAIADVTYHSGAAAPRYQGSDIIGVYPEQIGDSQQLDFTSAAANGAAQASNVIARVVAVDANCRVTVGADAVATTANSQLILTGQELAVFVKTGERVSVVAA